MNITVKDMLDLNPDRYQILDIRSKEQMASGRIPGAIHADKDHILETPGLDQERQQIVCCSRGRISVDVAEELVANGYNACSLEGGFAAWLLDNMKKDMAKDFAGDVEKSLQKKFRKSIWCKFTKAINNYELVKEGDRIAVCISGGKDSMLMAKCFQELKRHNKFNFEVKFIVMDPGYSPANREHHRGECQTAQMCRSRSLNPRSLMRFTRSRSHHVISAPACAVDIYIILQKSMGCNKIALGHHYDDVIETILMGMLYGAQVQTMMPKLHSTEF